MTETVSNGNELEVRKSKLQELLSDGKTAYPYRYQKEYNISDIRSKYADITQEDNVTDQVNVAGRMIAKRGQGKAFFGNIQDMSGSIQIYVKIDELGETAYQEFLKLDIGDHVGIKGVPFMTKRGELSIKVSSYQLLAKSLRPLPEKWHGLQDKETRYRQRYLDLIANPEVKDVFIKRSKIIKMVRDFLDERDFLEVETPVLQTIASGAAAKPFVTHHNALSMDLFMRIALELPLKKLIIGGIERIYEIGRVFRNEGISFKHNPEYSLLELYQTYADYTDMMTLTEELISGLAQKLYGTTKITYQGKEIDLSTPWERISYSEINDIDEFEKNRMDPVFVIDYPIEHSPLAKKHRQKEGLVERFEVICGGMELANAYSELNDPIDQKERFDQQARLQAAGDEEAESGDYDFVEAMEYGMPPTGGLGIGIDRLIMILTDQVSIRDVIFFPHMRDKQ